MVNLVFSKLTFLLQISPVRGGTLCRGITGTLSRGIAGTLCRGITGTLCCGIGGTLYRGILSQDANRKR